MSLRSVLTIAIVTVLFGCRPAPEPVAVPPELHGVWTTAHPRYENRFFELTVNTITLGIGEGGPQPYPIERFEKRQEMREIIYSLTYRIPSEGVANALSFYYEPRGRHDLVQEPTERRVEARAGIMTPAYRRRHFLVDTFQYRLLAISIGHIVLFALLVAASLFLPSIMVLLDASQSIAQKGQAADVFLLMDARFWPSALLMLVLIGAHSVLVSHRIAGPLVGFRRVLKAVEEGDLSVRARIRRHDYLTREAESINGMIVGVGGQVTEVQEQFKTIRAAWGELRTSLHTASTEETARGVETLGAQINALGARLDRFKVGL